MRWYRTRFALLIAGALILSIAMLLFILCRADEDSETPGVQAVALADSQDLVSCLSNNGRDLVVTALSVLKDRRDPAGKEKARELLKSEDSYVRLNAALYLGALGGEQAVPCLIRALSHPAWRAHEEAAAHLRAITGQDFGTDYEGLSQ